MKNLLKYLILSLIAFAYFDSADTNRDANCEVRSEEVQGKILAISTCISVPDSDICIPRQVSSVNAPRLQSNCRRNESNQRQNQEVVRAGKATNLGIKYNVQRHTLISKSSLMEPGHKLSCLCKLII